MQIKPMKIAIATTLAVFLLGISPAAAGFDSPESLIHNVYAHYGRGAAELSSGLPRDSLTAARFFDRPLRSAWAGPRREPYDFLVQSSSWKLGAISMKTIRKQYDKTYVAVTFDNQGRAVTLNFVVVNTPEGWVILDVESPHDSLRMFLTQHRN
jgi:hypothetical protein